MRIENAQHFTATAGGEAMSGRRLRIVHCFRAPVGGVFRHVSDLVEAQHRAGHAVGIICDSSTGGAFEDKIFARLMPSLELGLKRLPMRRQIAPSDIAATWRAMREVRSLNPEILHAHGAKGGVYARVIGTLLRASGSRVARIYTPHGGSLHYDPKSKAGRVFFAAERFLGRLTDAFIFVSQYEADIYAEKVGKPRRPATVVLNGLRPEEYLPVPPVAGARDFLFIGEMRDLKGPDVFIEAIAQVRARGMPATAVMVGSGDDRPRYEAMVRDLGLYEAVEFRQPMPARQAFALARTVVVPSRAESMPYIVLEAIAAGLPIIATRVGGIAEIFGDAARRLVPAGDGRALADAMAAMRSGPENAVADAARLRAEVEPRFSIAAMAAAVEEVYRGVVVPAR